MIRKNNQLQNIRFAYSHAHALSQCKNKLEELGLKPITHLDTAGAAKFISENDDKKNAAVASSLAAKIYDLKIIKKNIEDDKNNITRFLVFSKKSLAVNLKKKIITTIVKTGIATDCMPVARPDIITVAGPVSPSLAIFFTGLPPV